MNTFLSDLEFGKTAEKELVKKLNDNMPLEYIYEINDLNSNDFGCDIKEIRTFGGDRDISNYIDVKAYKPPLFIKSFKGFYLETKSLKSGNLGWLLDPDKKTTAYILLKDAVSIYGNVSYKEAYYISKKELIEACEEANLNGDLIKSKCAGKTEGVILPYRYLKKFKLNF